MSRPLPASRADYAALIVLATRWDDDDRYGHMNNTVHYRLVDTAVNQWLIGRGLLDPADGARIGLVVESGCRYHAEMAFPDQVTLGLRIAHLGNSSVRWQAGLFRNDQSQAAAEAHFTHVYVDPVSRRPLPLPAHWRAALTELLRSPG